jgi:tetratricopeptide (TPR) repeat protein
VDRINTLGADIVKFYGASFPQAKTEPVLRDLLAQYPGSGRLTYLVGQYFQAHGDTAEAAQLYAQAVRHAPRLREAHLAQGKLAEAQGNNQKARRAYERARALNETAPDAYRALLRVHRQQERLDGLIRRWQVRLRTMPDNAALREALIEALHKAGRYDEARRLSEASGGSGTSRPSPAGE